MPSGFSVASSPLTGAGGTIAVTGAGDSTQYIDGSGALQTFPTLLSSDNLVKLVRNQSGATMTAGTIVYISGATGNKPLISKAIATSDATSAQTYGLVQANIANNADGYVVVIGNVGNLNTSALTEGQQLYLSGTTAGAYTTTKPYAPTHLVYVGIVLRSHPTQGIIGVKIQNGYEMDELHNVDAYSPSNNDILSYNTSTSLWEHKQIATTLGFTPISLASLSAVSPLIYNNGTGAFSIQVATASQNGYLSSTDWSTFNNKQAALGGTGFVKISGSTISYDNSTYYLASNPSGYITLASLSAGTGISYSNTTGVISSTITQYTDALARAAISSSATGLTYTSATGVFSLTAGYAIPTTAKQTEWDTAYTNRITSLTTTGTSGAATLVGNTLNIPNYTTDLSGYVTLATSQTISGAKTFSETLNILKGTRTLSLGAVGYANHINIDSGVDFSFNYNNANTTGGIGFYAGTTTQKFYVNNLGEITIGSYKATAIADTYISSSATWNAKQAALNGTGFVKATGTTISYDNSTYLTTASAASTYVPYTGATANVNLGAYALQVGGVITTGRTTSDIGGSFVMKIGNGSNNVGDASSVTMYAPTASQLMFVYKDAASIIKLVSLSPNQPDSTQRYFSWPSSDGQLALVSQLPSLSGYVSGTGDNNYITKFTTTGSTIGNSNIYSSAYNVGINTTFAVSTYLPYGGLQVAIPKSKSATTNTQNHIAFLGTNDSANPLGLIIGTGVGASGPDRFTYIESTEVGISPNTLYFNRSGGKIAIGVPTLDDYSILQIDGSTKTTALNIGNMASLGSLNSGYIYLNNSINFRSSNGSISYGTINADSTGYVSIATYTSTGVVRVNAAVPSTSALYGYMDYSGGTRLFSVGASSSTKGTFSFIGKGADNSEVTHFSVASNSATTFSGSIGTNGYTANNSYAALFNGFVGIKTTTPIDTFEVAGAITTSSNALASKGSSAYFDYYSGAARIGVMGVNNSSLPNFQIDFYSANSSIQIQPFKIYSSGSAQFNSSIGIGGSPAQTGEMVRITQSGSNYFLNMIQGISSLFSVQAAGTSINDGYGIMAVGNNGYDRIILNGSGNSSITSNPTFSSNGNYGLNISHTIAPSASTFNNGATFAGSNNYQQINWSSSGATINSGAVIAGFNAINRNQFTGSGVSISVSQAGTGIRAISAFQILQQTGGSYAGTISHGASMFIQGIYPTNTLTTTFTNYYGLLINALDEWQGSLPYISITNRYGIYQAGSSDKNYLAAKLGIGVTDATAILDVRTSVTNGVIANFKSDTQGLGISITAASLYTAINHNNTSYAINFNTGGGKIGINSPWVLSSYFGTSGLQISNEFSRSVDNSTHHVMFVGSNDATYPVGMVFGFKSDTSSADARIGYIIGTQIGQTPNHIALNPDGSSNVLIGTYTNYGYRLTLNGQPGANGYTAWTNYSDIRLKENVADFYSDSILNKIEQLRPVTFNYNTISRYDIETRNRRISGFIAQELKEIFPEMVGTINIEGQEYYDTNLSNLSLYLVKGIQELYKELKELKQQKLN